MGNVAIVLSNVMAAPGSEVYAASSASASMDDMNLCTEAPSEFWRSTSNAPRHAWFYGTNTRLGELNVNAVGLIGHNLSRGDQYRIVLSDTADPLTQSDGYQEVAPNGDVPALTSNTGALYSDVDNAESSTPGTFVTRTGSGVGTGGWSIGLAFGTPTDDPATGADKQAFWVYVKGTFANGEVKVSCSLYEGGTLRASLGSRPISSATGQWICFPWDASLLQTTDGSDVQCALSLNSTTGSDSHYGYVWSVFWASDPNIVSAARDSGWVTYDPDITTSLLYYPAEQKARVAILHRESAAVSTQQVFVYLRVIGADPDFSYGIGQRTLPAADGYCQVGTLVVGESWSPTHNIGYGKLAGAIDISSRMRTYGGQLFGSRRPTRRVIGMRLGYLTPVEAHTLFDRVIWRGGVLKPVLISLLPDDATQSKHTTILAVLRNPENWINIQPHEGVENNMEMEWEEVL